MTESVENKPKKLTLNSSKLSLGNRSLPPKSLQQNFITSKTSSNVMVEVKKSKVGSSLSLNKKPEVTDVEGAHSADLSPELSKKLSIFKKAER